MYLSDGVLLPSVTTIINIVSVPWLLEWRGRVGNERANCILAETSIFGTKVHDLIEQINLGRRPDVPKRYSKHVAAFIEWRLAQVNKIMSAEEVIFDHEAGYAGTMDIVAEMKDGSLALVDLKTSNNMMETYKLQVAAYRVSYEKKHQMSLDRSIILKIARRDASLETIELHNHDKDYEAFRACLNLWNWYYQNDLKVLKEKYEVG